MPALGAYAARLHYPRLLLLQAHHLITPTPPDQTTSHPDAKATRDGSISEQSSVIGCGGDEVAPSQPTGDCSDLVETLLSLPTRQRLCVYAADVHTARTSQLSALYSLVSGCADAETAIREASLVKTEPGAPLTRTEVLRVSLLALFFPFFCLNGFFTLALL